MAERVTDEDLELLEELGVETAPAETGGRTAREQRIIAGFEEIERFVEEHGRLPEHGEDRDIFERLYAVRLDRIRESEECREVLKGLDSCGLLEGLRELTLSGSREGGSQDSDEDLLAALGVEEAGNEVTDLVHVRSRQEIKAAEEVARRAPCRDFAEYKAMFERVQHELTTGQRKTLKYGGENAPIKQGDLFILEGQKVLVAHMGESFVSDYGRENRKLRVIYDNGTESEPLLRSLQRALYEDKASRRITEPGFGPLFAGIEEEGDVATGYIYVLRSKSDHPFVAEHRNVIHKIGLTVDDVESRIAGAKKESTYLLADVEVVATFKVANINLQALEALLHKFFGQARLDMELKDRFGFPVAPREWFLLPFPVIEAAIEKLIDGTIGSYRYDKETASLLPA